MRIEKIIRVGKKRGLDGIAITDHNPTKLAIDAIKSNRQQDFFVISGSEIQTDRGEIVGLFLNEAVKSRRALEVIDDIRSQSGISIIAHPYKRRSLIDKELLGKVDGVEAFNARANTLENRMAYNIALRNNLLMSAGSDAHFYFEIGRGICITENASDMEDLRREILRKKTKITGTSSSPYVEPLSQVIRAFRNENVELLFTNVLLRAISATYHIVKDRPRITPQSHNNRGVGWIFNRSYF
jgi:hypothetical protein